MFPTTDIGSFKEFLDQALLELGMTHRHEMSSCGQYSTDHFIEKIEKRECPILPFFSISITRNKVVAKVLAEPQSPIHFGSKNKFLLQVLDDGEIDVLQRLVDKFNQAGFEVKGEITFLSHCH